MVLMGENRSGKDVKFIWRYAVVACAMLAIGLFSFSAVYAIRGNSTTAAPNQTNNITIYRVQPANANVVTGAQNVVRYDFNVEHLYHSNASVDPVTQYLNAAIYGPATIYGNVLLVSTMGNLTNLENSRYDLTNGSVAAVDLNTGKLLWRDYFPNQIMSEPIAVDNLAVVGISNNGEVPARYYNTNYDGIAAINITTGQIVWITRNNDGGSTGPDMPTPAYFNGNIIEPGIGSVDFLNLTTGRIVNIVSTGLPDTLSSPLLANGTIYFGAGYATVYGFKNLYQNLSDVPVNVITNFTFFAMNATTGNFLWSDHFPNAGGGLNDVSPALWNGTVVTGFLYRSDYADPWVVGINMTTGNVLWETNETAYIDSMANKSEQLPSTINFGYNQNSISPVTIFRGTAYLDSNFLGYLVAVNISTGKIIWAVNTSQDESNPNVFYGNYLLQINDNGILYVLNATTGSLINHVDLAMPHLSGEPIITSKYAILTGMDGRIIYVPLSTLING